MDETNEFIQFKELSNYGILNLYTKKPFNFNSKIVSKNMISKQYEIIQEKTNYKFTKIIKPNQNHTNIVKKVDLTNINDNFDNVDGLITNIKGVALVTSLADCQGIFLYDPKNNVIGNIHSGWKGTLNRIIINGIKLMISEYNSNIDDIKIYFCPSILKCCFEVEEEVKNKFLNNFSDIKIENYIIKGNIKDKKQKYMIDTVSINIELIKKIGILEKNIFTSKLCTKCNSDIFYSHRADKSNDGRNIALIAIK